MTPGDVGENDLKVAVFIGRMDESVARIKDDIDKLFDYQRKTHKDINDLRVIIEQRLPDTNKEIQSSNKFTWRGIATIITAFFAGATMLIVAVMELVIPLFSGQ